MHGARLQQKLNAASFRGKSTENQRERKPKLQPDLLQLEKREGETEAA